MRSLLKAYVVALPCFLLVGLLVLHQYTTAFSYLTDTWQDEPAFPVAVLPLVALLGFLSYMPLMLLLGGAPMAIAALLYVLLVMVARARALGWGWAMLGGVVAAAAAAAVTRAVELRLTPELWWQSYGLGCMIAGGLSAELTAGILRRWVAPAERGGDVAKELPEHGNGVSFAVMLAAFAVAALAAGAALTASASRAESVLLHRDADAAALTLRNATTEQQATLLAALMAMPAHKASIAERMQPDGAMKSRAIRDREQLMTELAAIRARAGPVLSTRYNGFDEQVGSGPGSATYFVLFIDRHANATTRETLRYQLQGRDVVLTSYNLSVESGKGTLQVGLVVSR